MTSGKLLKDISDKFEAKRDARKRAKLYGKNKDDIDKIKNLMDSGEMTKNNYDYTFGYPGNCQILRDMMQYFHSDADRFELALTLQGYVSTGQHSFDIYGAIWKTFGEDEQCKLNISWKSAKRGLHLN